MATVDELIRALQEYADERAKYDAQQRRTRMGGDAVVVLGFDAESNWQALSSAKKKLDGTMNNLTNEDWEKIENDDGVKGLQPHVTQPLLEAHSKFLESLTREVTKDSSSARTSVQSGSNAHSLRARLASFQSFLSGER